MKHVVLVVNKIDLVGYDADVFDADRVRLPRLRRDARLRDAAGDPGLGPQGRQHPRSRARTRPWYRGPQLMPYLESIEVGTDRAAQPMRFPVQWVNRPNLDFRGFSGTVASGVVKVGDDVLVAASRKPAKVTRIVTMDGDQQRSHRRRGGHGRPRPRSRYLARRRPHPSRRDARILQPVPGPHGLDGRGARPIRAARISSRSARRPSPASITDLKFRTNVNTLEHSAAKTLELNEVGTVTIATDKPIAFDPYAEQRPHRRLHPHRPHHQRDARGRGHRFRPAPRAEPQLPVLRREPRGSRPP